MNSGSLITRYRPSDFSYVYGHKEIIASIQNTLEQGTAHCFLFIGESGLGKTTLARLIAKHTNSRIIEFDAGTQTGIDDINTLLEGLRYRPINGENCCYILNEVQGLSKKAFDALLMSMEDTPEWLYFCLTTTEASKIPATLDRQRCATYNLKPVDVEDLIDLLEAISEAESLTVASDIVTLCARAANGSPRRAISNLTICAACTNREEASKLLEEADNPSDAIELIRALVAGKGWPLIQPILERLKDTNPESIRHVCRAYLTQAIVGSKDVSKVTRLFEMLEMFSTPFNSHDQLSPVVLAVGRILFAQEI
jgi:DNA polymerase III gamma/tau subunit